ncbi:LCP family protein, partial [Rhodococcus sp. NPDC058514]|uniref:LCP family protein n=1 Tax=Rhodococcus sp. NPDC058514 TaxID=3346532 RepID=UPI00364A766A
MNGDNPQYRDPRDPRAGHGGSSRNPQPPHQGRPVPPHQPRQGRPVPPQQGHPVPPRRVPPPRPGRPMPPAEGTQVIRRDGRPVQPPQSPRAWSQAPEPGQRGTRPAGPQQTRAYRPEDRNPRSAQGASPYAPTQTPQPYADPHRRQAGRAAPPAAPPRTSPAAPPQQPPRPARTGRKPHWGRRIGLVLVALLLIAGGSVVYLDRGLNRIDALADYPGRIGDTPGTNWLLVGSDSRTGLTPEQEQELATGGELDSKRTDTIIVVHIPKSGKATMVSIPRDSYVTIPG